MPRTFVQLLFGIELKSAKLCRYFRMHSLSTNGAARKAISLGRHLIRGH